MLATLILCAANCGPALSIEDELGTLSRNYMALCYELNFIQAQSCPELSPPPIVQCINEVDRELPLNFSNQFKAGMRLLQQSLAEQMSYRALQTFRTALSMANGVPRAACEHIAIDNKAQRAKILQDLKFLPKKSY